MKILQLAACMFCVAFLSAAMAVNLPVIFHAGRLDQLERGSDSRKFILKDAALKQNRLAPGENDVDLVEERSPEDNQVFVVLNISVYPGRSIGPSDYLLQAEGSEYPCQGMASARNQVFDFRLQEVKGPAEVLLIFSCPASARGATLKSAHAEMPVPPISGLVLQEPEPEPAPVVEAETAAETPVAEKPVSEKAAATEPAQDAAPGK